MPIQIFVGTRRYCHWATHPALFAIPCKTAIKGMLPINNWLANNRKDTDTLVILQTTVRLKIGSYWWRQSKTKGGPVV